MTDDHLTNKLHLKQKLYKLKMNEGRNLIDHMNVFNGYLDRLQKVDIKVEEEDKALLLLTPLPDPYENLVTTLLHGKDILFKVGIVEENWVEDLTETVSSNRVPEARVLKATLLLVMYSLKYCRGFAAGGAMGFASDKMVLKEEKCEECLFGLTGVAGNGRADKVCMLVYKANGGFGKGCKDFFMVYSPRKEMPIDFSLECILDDIENLARRLTSVSFAYVSRESNLDAHSVAKFANENSNGDGPSDSATAGGDAEVTNVDDGDELYIDELNELEASFSKVAIQEPGTDA
ncbi:hypothetical protein ACFX1Q_032525 [Malus domestica]